MVLRARAARVMWHEYRERDAARTPALQLATAPALSFFFTPRQWSGTAENREPHKHDRVERLPLDALPEKTIPYIRAALTAIRAGERYSEFGWEAS